MSILALLSALASAATPPELLTLHEVAQVFRVSKSTIRRLVNTGKLPAPIRVGRTLRWRRGELVAFLNQPKKTS